MVAGVQKVSKLGVNEVSPVASFRPSAAHALRPDEDHIFVALLADLRLHRVEAPHVQAAGARACVLVGQAALALIEYAEAEPVVVQSAFVEVATLVREATLTPAPREGQRSRIGLSAGFVAALTAVYQPTTRPMCRAIAPQVMSTSFGVNLVRVPVPLCHVVLPKCSKVSPNIQQTAIFQWEFRTRCATSRSRCARRPLRSRCRAWACSCAESSLTA